LTTQYNLLTYYLLTYLLKSNPGNPVPATGYPVPKPVPTSNDYYTAVTRSLTYSQCLQWHRIENVARCRLGMGQFFKPTQSFWTQPKPTH